MVVLTVVALAVWVAAVSPPPRGGWHRWRTSRPRWARRSRRTVDVGEFVAEVATRLRSGATTERAWSLTARRWALPEGIDDDGVPHALLALPPSSATLGACAAARLAHELGSPLADMLDGCAAALTQSDSDDAARRAALAGPVASARLLATLPALGLLLGTVVGADPLGQLLGGGLGTLVGLGGCLLYGLGVRWTLVLVRRARSESLAVP